MNMCKTCFKYLVIFGECLHKLFEGNTNEMQLVLIFYFGKIYVSRNNKFIIINEDRCFRKKMTYFNGQFFGLHISPFYMI